MLMKYFLTFFIITPLLLCCNNSKNQSFKIGDIATQQLTGGYTTLPDAVTASGSIVYHSCDVVSNKCKFTIGVDENKRIQFIQTTDKSFETPKGLMIGKSTFKDALKYSDFGVKLEGGFALYVPLKSGWNAVVDTPSSFWLIETPFDMKIIYFFKRE